MELIIIPVGRYWSIVACGKDIVAMTPNPVAFPVGITEVNYVTSSYLYEPVRFLQRRNLPSSLST